MRCCGLLVILACLAPMSANEGKDRAVALERKKFEGLWELIQIESEGKKPYTIQTYLVIQDDKWTQETLRRKQQWEFRIAPTADPQTIDLVQKDAEGKETIEAGIYKLDKDVLTVCTARPGKPRPKEFKSTAGVVRTFKRVEKKREPVRVVVRTRDGKVHVLAGRDAILECIMNKKQDELVLLLQEGHDIAEPYRKDGSWTFLHLAVSGGNVPAAEALIAAGAEVNASFKGGPTPLELAEERAGKLMIALLRKHGARDADKDTEYHAALLAGLHRLAAAGEARHVEAILDKHPKLVDARRQLPADRKPTRGDDFTALHHAVDNGHDEVVAALLARGADVQRTCEADWTALHLAAANGDVTVARRLIEAGAKLDAKTKAIPEQAQPSAAPGAQSRKFPAVPARTPLDVALDHNNKSMVRYLESVQPARKTKAAPDSAPNEAIVKRLKAIPVPAKTPFDTDERKKADYLRSYRDGYFWSEGNHLWCPTNPSADNLHAIRGWIEGWQAGVKAGGIADLPAKYAPYVTWTEPARAKAVEK